MSFTHKPGHGSLFRNDKDGNENRPDYKGSIALEDGTVLEVAGWLKDGQKGKYLSLKAQPPRNQPQRQAQPEPQARGGFSADLDDEIPF